MGKRIEKHSETWQAVAEWASKRRALATADLIQGSTTPGKDDKLRGDIRAMDDLLSLTDNQEPDPPTPVSY